MAYTFTKYRAFTQKQYNGNAIDFDTDTIKAALVTSSYTPDGATHDFFNDITNEVTGSGYTAGGAALANVTWTYNGTLGAWVLDADDVQWTENASGFENGYRVVLYKDTGTAATSPLIAYGSAMSPELSNKNGNATLRWSANGIFSAPV